MEYLNATNSLTPERRRQGEAALNLGISQTLENQIMSGTNKGAFSIWNRGGYGKTSDSIFLTAYVCKCFGKAKHFTYFQHDARLNQALSFLSGKQKSDGSFPEYGRVTYAGFRSEASQGIALTAFTVIGFLECRDYIPNFSSTITKALDLVSSRISQMSDNYALAISSYALALAFKRRDRLSTLSKYETSANQALNILRGRSTPTDTTMYWSSGSTGNEIAAYAILSHIQLRRIEEMVKAVNWLVSQRNSYGGFSSTQDTMIGLQALSEVAFETFSPKTEMVVKFTSDRNEDVEFKMNKANWHIHNFETISPLSRSVHYNAVGDGTASIQVSWSFNVQTDAFEDNFFLDLKVTPNTPTVVLELTACTRFKSDKSGRPETGMAIMEVTLPSGYVIDKDYGLNQMAGATVKKIFKTKRRNVF
jgi:CD109 antigen